jgi:signal transduction histidine kinase
MGDEKPTVEQVAYLLSRIDLFRSFSPITLRLVARACVFRRVAAGEVLFEHGDEGASLFIVLDGTLEVFRGERAIALIGRNEYIGELALLDPGPRSASVRATVETSVLEVPRTVFDLYLRQEPESLIAMTRTITRRLRSMLDETQNAYEQLNMQVHDMLNLLNVLGGAGLVADVLPAGDPHHRYLEMILNTRDRLEAMMREALRKARGERAKYAKAPTDLQELVHNTLRADLALHPDVRRTQVVIQRRGALTPCLCNAADLQRVVANLVINAAQASGEDGSVVISLWEDAEQAFIEVADDGPGIDPETQERIFEPHYSTKPQGSGLGLTSARQIVEQLHGGSLRCESVPGQGSRFTIALPKR